MKKQLASGVSSPVIDKYYQKAIAAGATGGKILGAGGGGFLLLYCDEWKQNDVKNALADLKISPFRFAMEGSKIIYTSD